MLTDSHLWYVCVCIYVAKYSQMTINGMPCFHIFLESVYRWPTVVRFVFVFTRKQFTNRHLWYALFSYLPRKCSQMAIFGMLSIWIAFVFTKKESTDRHLWCALFPYLPTDVSTLWLQVLTVMETDPQWVHKSAETELLPVIVIHHDDCQCHVVPNLWWE